MHALHGALSPSMISTNDFPDAGQHLCRMAHPAGVWELRPPMAL